MLDIRQRAKDDFAIFVVAMVVGSFYNRERVTCV